MSFSFNPLNNPIMLDKPEWLTRSPAWQEHIPFAMFLVSASRPRVIVELGTLLGDSYCAFCQSIKKLGLETRCYAVDTWEGDEHSGYYGDKVLPELRAYHDPRYGSFSQLMQSYFDDALPHIPDGTVDILHIDGLHTYEAVKHDFESWLPKMSERGIVLFHDTNVRRDDFGVHRLWDELKQVYLNFEFLHGYGLGVLAVGEVTSPDLLALFNATPEETSVLRDFFFSLGRRAIAEDSLLKVVPQVAKLTTELNESENKNHQLRSLITAAEHSQQSAEASINDLNEQASHLRAQASHLSAQLEGIVGSRGWKLLEKTWQVRRTVLPYGSLRAKLVKSGVSFFLKSIRSVRNPSPDNGQKKTSGLTGDRIAEGSVVQPNMLNLVNDDYLKWVERHDPSQSELEAQRDQAQRFEYRPLISIVTPVYNTPPQILRAAIESVIRQTYDNWELCLTIAGNTNQDLVAEYASRDHRIKAKPLLTNNGISGNTNEGIKIAEGEFIALLDHDDELAPHALFEYVSLLNQDQEIDIFYSDEDKLDENGIRLQPFFKPDWSPEYFRGVMYVGHLLCFRRKLIERAGYLDSRYDGVQDFELMLRLSELGVKVGHVPKILYHWRQSPGSIALDVNAKPNISNLQMEAVNAHLLRVGLNARAEIATTNHQLVIKPFSVQSLEMVTIIIPTKDEPECLENCLSSIYLKSSYTNFEVLLIDNDTKDAQAIRAMEKFPVTRINMPGTFNYSRANNLGTRYARGKHLLFLNNDTLILTPDWIEQLLYYSAQEDVGAAGALLLYPDNTVQHAGINLGPRETADHLMRGFSVGSDGYAGSLICAHEVSAVTAACLMMKKIDFENVGGFNEHYFTHYQDLDLCLKLREMGKRIIFTPQAKLTHFESKTRKDYYDHVDYTLLLDQWQGHILNGDPYYNPNFNPRRSDYTLDQ